MKREMKLGLLFVVAFALLCSSATSQAYNENWQEDAENCVMDQATFWNWDPNPSNQQYWANFTGSLEVYWNGWDRIHGATVTKYFTDVRFCGYLNSDGDGDTLANVTVEERDWTGIFVHGNAYISAGYMGIIRQASDGLYFELGDNFTKYDDLGNPYNTSWDYMVMNDGAATMLIPGTDTGSSYDIPYWCVVTAEAWNYRDMGTPEDTADDLCDMYVTTGLWLSEEDWLNEVEPVGYFETDDLDVDRAHAVRYSGIHGRGEVTIFDPGGNPIDVGECSWDMLDSYQLNEYSGGFNTTPRGTGEPGLGDYNGDNTVDQADFTTWADSYGDTGTGLPADGNGDGVIDQADFTTWADNYGNVYSPAAEGTNAKYTGEYPGEDFTDPNPTAAVPEPATLMLLGLGGLAAIRRRK